MVDFLGALAGGGLPIGGGGFPGVGGTPGPGDLAGFARGLPGMSGGPGGIPMDPLTKFLMEQGLSPDEFMKKLPLLNLAGGGGGLPGGNPLNILG